MAAKIQPAWVLQTASGDRSRMAIDPREQHEILHDTALLNARSASAESLFQAVPESDEVQPEGTRRIALALIGELRCFHRSAELLKHLSRQADLFIVTTHNFRHEAAQLTHAARILIVENLNHEREVDAALAVPAMKQWHKLHLALQLIRNHEERLHQRYRFILKLRSDYFFVHPQQMLKRFVAACRTPQAGLVGASDKVFGGRRDLMMLLQGLFPAIPGWFDQRETTYWPINLEQVLRSDDAIKWYGMNWPQELVGQPDHPLRWRQALIHGGASLGHALARYRHTPSSRYHRLLVGHERFSSEICFSRYLNFCGIPFRDCRALRGLLYMDRNRQP